MSHVPHFLKQLDLGLNANERDIRRTYAKRLKLIDQQADLEGFQQLRENYEAALNWARYQAQVQAAEAAEAGAGGTEASPSPKPLPEPPRQASPDLPTHDGDALENIEPIGEGVATETRPSPEALAQAVFQDFMAALPLASLKEKIRALHALDHSLADPRLLSIDASAFFEWLVARTLTDGWHPGHEVLFVAAAERFDWFNDQHRLFQFGRVGHFINTALNERLTYDSQSGRTREAQRQLILQLRQANRPGTGTVVRSLPHLEQLLRTFPNWLSIIAPVDNIQRWREWDHAIPHWRRRLTYQSTASTTTPAPAPQKTSSWNRAWVAIAIFMAIIQLAKINHQSPSPLPSASHSSYSSTPRESASSNTDWEKPEPLPLEALNPLAKHPANPSSNLYPQLPQNPAPEPRQAKARQRPAAEVKPVVRSDDARPKPNVPLDLSRHFGEPLPMLMLTQAPRPTPAPPPAPEPLPPPAYRLSGKEAATPERIAPEMPAVDYSLKPVP